MSLKQQVEADIKKAMLAKDRDTLRALRGIKSLILLAETEKGNKEELTQEKEVQLLSKAVKQRRESIEVFEQQGREDLAANERAEVEVINQYLPQPLSRDEIHAVVQKVVEDAGASGMQDMGKVMGIVTKELAGKADGKTIAEIVKQTLSN